MSTRTITRDAAAQFLAVNEDKYIARLIKCSLPVSVDKLTIREYELSFYRSGLSKKNAKIAAKRVFDGLGHDGYSLIEVKREHLRVVRILKEKT